MRPASPLKNSVISASAFSINGLFPEINLEPVLPLDGLKSSSILLVISFSLLEFAKPK